MRARTWCAALLLLHSAESEGSGPSPRPRPRPSPTTRPTMRPTVSAQPSTATPTTVAAATCRQDIATASTPSLLISNYSSMEDAYDNDQHGHATYECASILIEEFQQYDKAEPYLWCVLDHCADCDAGEMCPTTIVGLDTTAHCQSAVWNYLGFVSRKKEVPDYVHAATYYRTALDLWPENCGAMAYSMELFLTTGNATAARAMHTAFCDACGPDDLEAAVVAELGSCPTPAPVASDAARGRGPAASTGVLMLLLSVATAASGLPLIV